MSAARRIFLLMLAVSAVWRGGAYAFAHGAGGPRREGGAIAVLSSGLPEWVIGAVWIALGVYVVAGVCIGRWMWPTVALGAGWVAWGLGYLVAWIDPAYGITSDWISTGTYLPVGLAIWATTRLPETVPVPVNIAMPEEEDA